MTKLLSTREVADFLGIHEKKVYRLITEQGLPATKVTGKWLFPSHLVEQWIEANTINYPGQGEYLLRTPSLFVIAGSNDILLERSISLFMSKYPEYIAVFGNMGSMGGLKVLRQGLCHMASSHLAQQPDGDYNFAFAAKELEKMPAVINFCFRQQGLLLPKGNPRGVKSLQDIGLKDLTIVNRPLGTGTRLWFDSKLQEAGIKTTNIKGYDCVLQRHIDVGLEILSGRADIGPGIRTVAELLGLDFLPMHWERFDLLITKERFFDRNIQSFLSIMHDRQFHHLAAELTGYELSQSGNMVYPSKEL